MARKPATIRRAPHDSENPYKVVRRATFEDSSLSFEARGVMAYLLMKPDDWEININDLQREGGIGRDKTYKILTELIAARYLERVDERDKGQFGGATYLLHESPLPEKPDTVTPLPEKPDTDLPDTEKPLPVNPQETNKEKTTKKGLELNREGTEGAAPLPPPDDDVAFGDDKTLTPQQTMFAAICEAMGWDYRIVRREDKQTVGELVSDLSKAGYTTEDVRRYMVEVWFKDWRWEKRQERPKLEDIRKGIGVLRAVLPDEARASPTPSANGNGGRLSPVEKGHEAAQRLRERLRAQGKEDILG